MFGPVPKLTSFAILILVFALVFATAATLRVGAVKRPAHVMGDAPVERAVRTPHPTALDI